MKNAGIARALSQRDSARIVLLPISDRAVDVGLASRREHPMEQKAIAKSFEQRQLLRHRSVDANERGRQQGRERAARFREGHENPISEGLNDLGHVKLGGKRLYMGMQT